VILYVRKEEVSRCLEFVVICVCLSAGFHKIIDGFSLTICLNKGNTSNVFWWWSPKLTLLHQFLIFWFVENYWCYSSDIISVYLALVYLFWNAKIEIGAICKRSWMPGDFRWLVPKWFDESACFRKWAIRLSTHNHGTLLNNGIRNSGLLFSWIFLSTRLTLSTVTASDQVHGRRKFLLYRTTVEVTTSRMVAKAEEILLQVPPVRKSSFCQTSCSLVVEFDLRIT